jgi:hypothetical protein
MRHCGDPAGERLVGVLGAKNNEDIDGLADEYDDQPGNRDALAN